MQTHFDVIAVLIDPRPDLTPVESSGVENLDFVSRLAQLHCSDHSCEARADDTDFQLLICCNLDSRASESPTDP